MMRIQENSSSSANFHRKQQSCTKLMNLEFLWLFANNLHAINVKLACSFDMESLTSLKLGGHKLSLLFEEKTQMQLFQISRL